MKTSSYGVKQQTPSGGPVDRAAEAIRLQGWAIVEGGYTAAAIAAFGTHFDVAYERMCSLHGGRKALEEINEHNTIRAPLTLDAIFLELATNANILALCERLLDDYFVLNQQNGVINPPAGSTYNQSAYHRDLPYQHFVTSRPLAINALFCIDAFDADNGATKVIQGSHKQEQFPSDGAIAMLERQIEAPRGAFIVMDAMTFHSGGVNRTARPRRAMNHIYSLPFIRQQIDFSGALVAEHAGDGKLGRLLGHGNRTASDVADYYAERRRRRVRQTGSDEEM